MHHHHDVLDNIKDGTAQAEHILDHLGATELRRQRVVFEIALRDRRTALHRGAERNARHHLETAREHDVFESGADERWVDWAMQQTNLTAFAGRRILEISSGEFQRAVLARTLVQRPRLLLLDEPTANLDIGYQIEMLRLIRRLAESEDFIAVVVTHELNLAAEMADFILLLEAGRCLSQGSPAQVLESGALSRVFRTPVAVDRNPSSGRPRVTWIAP